VPESRSGAELFEQCLALAVTQAADATGRRDLQLGHDFLRLDLANLRQSLEERGDLHLAEDLVVLGVGEHLLQVGSATLEAVLQLGAHTASGGSLLECCCALLIGQLGKSHGSSVFRLYSSVCPR